MAPRPAAPKPRSSVMRPLTFAKLVTGVLEEKKGTDIVIMEMRKCSSVADYFVIVSGMERPHLKAMFEAVRQKTDELGISCYRKLSNPESGWLILDYVDVVIHFFLEETRKYYAIEDLWAKAPRK